MNLCERDPVAVLAPLLGPRLGLRARRPVLAALAAPFAFRMPASGTVLVTFTAGEEPAWNAQALEGMGLLAVEAYRGAVEVTLLAEQMDRLRDSSAERPPLAH